MLKHSLAITHATHNLTTVHVGCSVEVHAAGRHSARDGESDTATAIRSWPE